MDFSPPSARHFQIEQDDVDHHLTERLDRILRGAGNGDDLEIAVCFDHPAKDCARDHRIIDDHQPDRPARLSAGPSPIAGPGGGVRPAHGQSLRRRRRVAA